MTDQPAYPYDDGDVTVLGPEIFASKDGAVLSWRGVNYVRTTPDNPTTSSDATDNPHHYLSTGCHHGDHTYCQSMTGLNGAKRPGECKFCQAPCQCPCHQQAAGDGGPSVAECAADDRRYWDVEREGE